MGPCLRQVARSEYPVLITPRRTSRLQHGPHLHAYGPSLNLSPSTCLSLASNKTIFLKKRNNSSYKAASRKRILPSTHGAQSYDGLGDALQEGEDDLNDETFGSTVPVGMDSRKIGVLQPLNRCFLYQERTSTLRAARSKVCR